MRLRWWRSLPIALLLLAITTPIAAAQESANVDQAALLARLKELVEARGGTSFVTPAPGSRSNIIAVDISTALFFFLERGSIRGGAIDAVYAALDSGDMVAAQEAFRGNSIVTLRATDYGWNGLGVPMVTDSGSEIGDILFKDVGGVFRRAEEITPEDIDDFVETIQAVIGILESA